ncbi:serine hydrolase domain-containing protein [Dyella caseinilytica]|uniref:Beta-lactamase family protein n=1 Tax=Dyella caseinilytica TaxID=1849581 RepID=A0ABX7GYC8_9GAMM|nr:serine hydrolase domain-containing protein [Dyella caseinilytica]QRN55335.1 beta-lactamase family protein [Dyella caseinilytica]GGA01001.1 FmtA-like protein [Dyella caseinilytica]
MNRHVQRLVALIAGLTANLAAAQGLPSSPSGTTASQSDSSVEVSTPALTQQDLGSFFDGLIPFALRRSDIAGGVIVVVKDGNVLFAKGYGYADLAQRTPVSPDSTLFRPGSTSKLFTWTAVMQLVEQGKLQLDRDINDYLDFKIPPYQGKPITLRNLMTHTPGFEDSGKGLLPASIADVDLERYLKTHLPERIFPPGEIVAYSNYGCGLAGYIVQRVSGERFEDYIEHHIFQPLDMTHSTFAQPLPPSLAPLMAKGYKSASDGVPQPFELVDPAPAGAMSTSAMDMSHFMIAQLQNGAYGNTRILQAATAELMHSPQYTPAPGMPGFDLGFYQEDRNGLRIIGHGGDTVFFHSDLHLLLDKNIGVFMSFNSAGSSEAGGTLMVRTAIFDAFLDRYFPYTLPTQATSSTAKADAARVAGWYQASRRNESAMRVLYLAGQTSVAAQPDGTLTVSMLTDYAGQPLHWREVGPLQYREVNGQDRIAFVTNPDGSIRYWATDWIPAVEVFQRVPSYKSFGSAGLLAGIATLIVLVALLIWLFGWLTRRHYHTSLDLPTALHRTRLLSRLGALILLADVLGWVLLLVATAVDENVILHGSATPWLYVLYALGVIALLGVVAIVVHTWRSWYPAQRGWLVRTGESLLALAAIYLAWFILAFGMVSFSVSY